MVTHFFLVALQFLWGGTHHPLRRVHPDKEQRLWGSFSLPCVLHGTHSSPLFPPLLPASAKISSALLFSPLTTIRWSQREPPCLFFSYFTSWTEPCKGGSAPHSGTVTGPSLAQMRCFPLHTQAFASIPVVLMGVYPLSTDGQQQCKAVLQDHWHARVYLTALREILSMNDCL